MDFEVESSVKEFIFKTLKENKEFEVKKLGKLAMKPHKKLFSSKSERKQAFKQFVEKLEQGGEVKISEGIISLIHKSKRKHSDMEKEADDLVEKYLTNGGKNDGVETKRKCGDVTILLFYAYCQPAMTRAEQDNAIAKCYGKLKSLGMSGRLRVGREVKQHPTFLLVKLSQGFNCTLTGKHDKVREFTAFLREFDPRTFGETDFKYVDNLPDNQLLKELKVFPVTEIVTYGFNPADAPLDKRGVHLKPHEFHAAMENPNAVVIDVRNFNESLIGKFAPPQNGHVVKDDGTVTGNKILDPCMRRSTEFPDWVRNHKEMLQEKQVLMYCTAGVRCERASAFLKNQGIENVYQLEGGIHRYLEAYPEDGGYWVGKNYVFDKRYSHGAEKYDVISNCVYCAKPWDRYQAGRKCCRCAMEVLLCKECQRAKPSVPNNALFCPLCKK